jgi:competence protein ComEC
LDWNLTITRWIVDFFGSQIWAASWSPVWPWPWMVGYYLAILLCLDLLRPNLLTKKRQLNSGLIMIGLLVLLNLVVWAGLVRLKQGEYLQLSVIDVGQGDALFVQTPDGYNLLIDGGDEGKGIARVLPFLRSNGVERLNLVIASHGHRDHISGLAEVLEEIPAQKLCLPQNTDSFEIKEFLKRIRAASIIYQQTFTGQMVKLGQNINGEMEILAAPQMEDENNRSWVVLIKYGKNKLLLTGDLGMQGEAILARKYPAILRASVLKVGHHGSNYASGLAFISQVKPKVAIISVGAGNHFGHPGAKALNCLRSMGIHVYRTDRQGTVTVKIYKDRFTVSTLK